MKIVPLVVAFIGLFVSEARAQSLEMSPDGARNGRVDTYFEPGTDMDEGGEMEFFQARIGLPVYAHRSGEWIWGLKASYEFTSLDLSNDPIESTSLHRMNFGPTIAYRPENSPWRAFLSGSVGLSSDFSDVDGEDVIYSLLGAVSYKYSDSLSFLLGAYYSQDFGDSRLLPGIGFIWEINSQWTASLLPPRVRIAYSPSSDWRFSLEAYPDGGFWSVETADGEQASLERKALRTGVRVERKIADNSWAYVSGGWAFGREIRLEEEDSGRVPFESDVDDGAYFAVGLTFGF